MSRLVFYKRLKLACWLLCFFTHSCFNYAYAQQYEYVGDPIATIFTIEEHKSGNQVWWINQYVDGRMLFATGNGLSIWDGANWQQSSTPNNTRIRELTVWHDNNIYAGAVGELGYFSPTDTGEFSFTLIPTEQLIGDFGQTRSVNSNNEMVVYSTEQAILIWNGKTIQKIDDFTSTGSRVFNVDNGLFIEDGKQIYSIILVDDKPVITAMTWQFPDNLRIKSLFKNRVNEIVMVTNMQGIFKLQDGIFINVVAPDILAINHLNSGIQAQDGFYYINSTIDGLMIFDESFTLMRHYSQNDGIGLSTIYNIFQDRQQNIWLAGLPNISVFQPPHLRSTYHNNTGTLDFENIFNIDGTLFFSGTGFYQLMLQRGSMRSPIFKQVADFNLVVLDILALNDELIVGTEAGIYAFEMTKVDSQTIIAKPKLISTEDWVSELVLSPNQQLLYATIGNHLSQFEKTNGQWQERKLVEDKSGMEYLAIQPDVDDQYFIWFTTEQQELYRLSATNQNINLTSLLAFDKQNAPLGNDHLRPFMFQQKVYIGTQNGVIEFQESPSVSFLSALDLPESLRTPNKDVFRIEKDEKHRIWYHAGTDTGVVYQQSPGDFIAQEGLFKPYNRSGTRGLTHFDDAIWFGVANGNIFRLADDTIANLPQAAPLAVQYINSINRNVRLPIKGAIEPFSIDDSSIRIGFSQLDYSSQTKSQFRTKLEGPKQQRWTPWSTEINKDFTLLSGGDYTLHIEALDAWGRTSSTQHSFAITYPWYLSFWAKLFYFMLLLLIITLSVKLGQKLRNRTLEQQNKSLELGIKQRTVEISQKVEELKEQQILKDRFFANVSHEFRTPLTLTIGPLEAILKERSEHLDSHTKDLTITALNNAKTMLALVGQVLDINRLEIGQLTLRIAKHDVAALLRTSLDRFTPWAQQHQQQISCINCEDPFEVYCDLDQIEKCISNLLSNAIKYSGKGSVIRIELTQKANEVGLKITDNGRGILSSHKHQVFERYYQEATANNNTTPGTGIGLALVKELIELHSGSIELITEIDQGCQFTLWLKLGTSHFDPTQLLEPISSQNSSAMTSFNNELDGKDNATILVVDDNAELRQFICQRLAASFIVLEADSGHEGFDCAIKNLPDMIISDIAMPGLTGLELTQKLKNHIETKSIPILLLSAKAMKRDIVEGFACGADDYLVKPFDTSELIMRIKTLINSRKQFARQKTQNNAPIDGLAKLGDSFEDSFQKHIFAHLHDAQFNIDMLAELMFMSKETLRRKCQVSFQRSPSAHIQIIRLQQAKILLEQGKMNVSEVAYAVGFDSLAYFSKAFKKYFNVSPSKIK